MVKRVNDDVPVYVVRPELGSGPERILHRNLLLPLQSLPRPRPVSPSTTESPVPRKHPIPSPRSTENSEVDAFALVDEDDDDLLWMIRNENVQHGNGTDVVELAKNSSLSPDALEFQPRENCLDSIDAGSAAKLADHAGGQDISDEVAHNEAVIEESGELEQPVVEADINLEENTSDSDVDPSHWVRRSSRVKKPVDRLGVVVNKRAVVPEWQQKMDYLVGVIERLSANGINNLGDPVLQDILQIMKSCET